MKPNSGMKLTPAGLLVPDYLDVPLSPAVRAARSARATLAGSSATVAAGDVIATHTVSAKEYQVTMDADVTGHIRGSRDIYYYNIASTVHVAVANTVMWDLWNADASIIVRVLSILQIPNVTTAVTGVVFDWLLERTTAIGTGGTAQTAWPADSAQPALDADITCRLKPTGGATQSTDLRNYSISSEETNAATIVIAAFGGLEVVPLSLQPPYSEKGIVLRPSEGIRCVQITNSNAGNTGWLIALTQE